MFFPASAIMYASGQTDDNNSNGSSTGGGSTTTMDNNGSSTGGGSTTTMDNNGSSTGGGSTTTMDNNGSSTGGSTDNNATSPTTSTASNNTGNTADLANSILAVHNSERGAVGVPPLVWNDTLAADAKPWAEHLATTGEFRHCDTATEVCNYHGEGENLAGFNPSLGISAPGEGQQLWVAEKKNYHGGVLTPDNWYPSGHYTQMVWKDTKQVGCATASGNGHPFSILDCRYYPPGNYMGQAPY